MHRSIGPEANCAEDGIYNRCFDRQQSGPQGRSGGGKEAGNDKTWLSCLAAGGGTNLAIYRNRCISHTAVRAFFAKNATNVVVQLLVRVASFRSRPFREPHTTFAASRCTTYDTGAGRFVAPQTRLLSSFRRILRMHMFSFYSIYDDTIVVDKLG